MMGTAFGRPSLGLWVDTNCFALLITSRVMDGLTLKERRILIGNFHNENKDKGKPYAVHHFLHMKVPERTIYSIIKIVENDIQLKRRHGSGRPAVKMPKRRVKLSKTTFWPKVFNAGNVHYVKPLNNAPNVPNLRPISSSGLSWRPRFKTRVVKPDYDHMKSRIKQKLKEFPPSYFRNLMSKVKTTVRKAADNGLDSLFK